MGTEQAYRSEDAHTRETERLAAQALSFSRNELVVGLRFLSAPLEQLKPLPTPGATFATDGTFLRYDPATIARTWANDPARITRALLHVLLHNVFLHPFPNAQANAAAWDAACDIAVEHVIAELDLPACRTEGALRQRPTFVRIDAACPVVTAEAVYRHLLDQGISDAELTALREPFLTDDHGPWHLMASQAAKGASARRAEGEQQDGEAQAPASGPGESGTDVEPPANASSAARSHASHRGLDPSKITQKKRPENIRRAMGQRFADTVNLDRSRDQWKNAAYEMGVQLDSYAKLWGVAGSNLAMNLRSVTREKRDYREFLRRFARMGEHIRVNDDEFDYVYYCYGLSRYGNLPLIEPLEYAEERKVRDFVIAIDTSASTKDGLIRRFLERTWSILANETSFATDMNAIIIQADAAVADVARIKSLRELDRYLEHFEAKGLGGTDFRPVFSYVAAAIDRGELSNLGGLLYFTDGQGTYPARKPDYDVAFVFPDEAVAQASAPVPPWAMKVVLDETFSFEQE